MMAKKFRIPRKLKKKIPEGMYCYIFTGKKSQVWSEEFNQFVPAYSIRTCPFYFHNLYGFGDCKYLFKKHGIFNGETDLDICLDDQCKSCTIKHNYK